METVQTEYTLILNGYHRAQFSIKNTEVDNINRDFVSLYAVGSVAEEDNATFTRARVP